MTSAEFVNYTLSKGCKILDPKNSNGIRLWNPKTGGRFNVNGYYDEMFPRLIRIGCVQLGIEIHPLGLEV